MFVWDVGPPNHTRTQSRHMPSALDMGFAALGLKLHAIVRQYPLGLVCPLSMDQIRSARNWSLVPPRFQIVPVNTLSPMVAMVHGASRDLIPYTLHNYALSSVP